ncbi:MAG: 3-hydroxylacyl-ACP dehydratase [Spirochaetaceae bacterium]|jgi:predicted hotdog family 3-hydroxylacyl-ACP dehydratase|nr:3-hydroxylacyl-ACP dehydratase [Spirochaetaceae bacterium]
MITNVLEREELERLLPHRGRMVLLSRIIRYDDLSLTAEYDITAAGLFYDEALGGFPAWAGFECMAQAIAALGALSGQRDPRAPGCLLSVSAMTFAQPVLPCGSTVTVTVREEGRSDRVSSFHGALFLAETPVAEGKLTVMEGTTGTEREQNGGGQ